MGRHWLHSLFADCCWRIKMSRNEKGKKIEAVLAPNSGFFRIWWFTLWNTICCCYAVLLVTWENILGLGRQNKLNLEIRMLALVLQWRECPGLGFLSCEMGELNLRAFPEPAEHQNYLRRLLKAQLPWAHLTPAGLESLRVGPRECAFLKGSIGFFFPGPLSPNQRTPYLETTVLENLLRSSSSPNAMILMQQFKWWFWNREW